ncbi:hypothetical protein SELMODRAFT_417218 [Selaginella moellendorffii]|uniref:Uncharacterized protein n=1 Tax=Selaginella moellendorffii TaxID=88036 RepID=D8S1R8_SELML|nr:hypothetical protein SELMODRAFT_417218 [Selaginella moellendorffii]
MAEAVAQAADGKRKQCGSPHGTTKRYRRDRHFSSSDAINTDVNYYVPWEYIDGLVQQMIERWRWLLITGPFQSGKSSLMYAVADAVESQGYGVIVTTLTEGMVAAANDASNDMEGSKKFFRLLTESIERDSNGLVKRTDAAGGMEQVQAMFQNAPSCPKREVVWFIDEAALLNDIERATVVSSFLTGMRAIKQGCKSRHKTAGSYYLRSFVLVGTAKTKRLLQVQRRARMATHPGGGLACEPSSPSRTHDSYNPLYNVHNIFPLSFEDTRSLEFLTVDQIVGMLREYAQERGVVFTRGDGRSTGTEAAVKKIAISIHEQTNGYKGMVGACCEYLQNKNICTVVKWKGAVRLGRVVGHVFDSKVYYRIMGNFTKYPAELRSLVLECVGSGGSVAPKLVDVLPAINDGMLIRQAGGMVGLSSSMLLAVFLRDCGFSYEEALPAIETFEEAVQAAVVFIKPQRLAMEANSQPSEYIWQSELLLALKFVLEKGYIKHKYVILVEAKKRDKHGQKRVRVDFFLRNAGSPPVAFELQGVGNKESIIKHIEKSESTFQMGIGGTSSAYRVHRIGIVFSVMQPEAIQAIFISDASSSGPLNPQSTRCGCISSSQGKPSNKRMWLDASNSGLPKHKMLVFIIWSLFTQIDYTLE